MNGFETDGFVLLAGRVPDVLQEIRYYSTYNFVGERIDGYEEPCAIATKEAADALKAASDAAVALGYRLKVFDAYRPVRAVEHFLRWGADESDDRMKPYFYPELEKRELFEKGYIAKRSSHSRGSAVDLTLFDMRSGSELDMGGPFDLLGESSHPSCKGVTGKQRENRMLLQKIMAESGFEPVEREWWHFRLKDEPYQNTYFDFPVRSGYFDERESQNRKI